MEQKEFTVLMKGTSSSNKITSLTIFSDSNQRRLVSLHLVSYSLHFASPAVYPTVLLRVQSDNFASGATHMTKPEASTQYVTSVPSSVTRLATDMNQTFTRVDLLTPICIFQKHQTYVANTSISIEFLRETPLEFFPAEGGDIPDVAFLRFQICTVPDTRSSLYTTHSFLNE